MLLDIYKLIVTICTQHVTTTSASAQQDMAGSPSRFSETFGGLELSPVPDVSLGPGQKNTWIIFSQNQDNVMGLNITMEYYTILIQICGI